MLDKFTPPHPLNTAVLFLVFNRLDTTKQVFEAIREAKPPRLYIAADGAREQKDAEDEKVKAVREYIISNIDWECEVKTLFREQNFGCKMAVSGAIDWFFENEEMGIILEDDCLPSQSFFWFCEELLERYKDDMRVMMISGYNKLQNHEKVNDYFFSNIGGIWGWASWRRAWSFYEVDPLKLEKKYKTNFYKLKYLLGKTIYENRRNHFKQLINGLDTWDYQWGFARHFNSGLSCVSSNSLIQNVGFGMDATHTTSGNDSVVRCEIKFPLNKNHIVVADNVYDESIHGKKDYILKLKRLLIWIKRRIYNA